MNENAKTKLVLEYTGMDDFSCPVYKDQFGKLWKDIDLGKEPEPNLYSLSFNHIDGEPSHPIQQEYTFHPAPYQRSSYEFEYRMLSKLQSDCEYYLGYGNRSPSILCNHSVQNHIARMKELWNGFPQIQKPEWHDLGNSFFSTKSNDRNRNTREELLRLDNSSFIRNYLYIIHSYFDIIGTVERKEHFPCI